MRKTTKLNPEFKLWLSQARAKSSFGDGRWQLLKAIETEGSLRAACELLNISYRKAWGDLKKAEEALGVKLVKRQRGGRVGGETILTEKGRKWVKAYAGFHKDIEKAVEKSYSKRTTGLLK